MTTTTEKPAIEKIQDHIYSYVRRSADEHKRRLYFTDTGLARLTSIEGYLAALAETGHELAETLANENSQLEQDIAALMKKIRIAQAKKASGDDGVQEGEELLKDDDENQQSDSRNDSLSGRNHSTVGVEWQEKFNQSAILNEKYAKATKALATLRAGILPLFDMLGCDPSGSARQLLAVTGDMSEKDSQA